MPCLHFHSNRIFRLHFCRLSAYRYRSYVQHQYEKFEKPGDYHVVLPVLLNDRSNEFDPPKDMIMGYSEPQPSRGLDHQPMRQTNSSDTALDYTMQLVQVAMTQHGINATPPSSSSSAVDPPDDTDHFQPPLWGLDRDFNTAYNTGNREYISNNRLAQAFTPPPPVPSTAKMSVLKGFPLLQTDPRRPSSSSSSSSPSPSSSKYKPSLSIEGSPKRRVLRIVPQKTAATSHSPTPSRLFDDQINTIKNYNYSNIKNALSKGLESVRGFKGELKLFAK